MNLIRGYDLLIFSYFVEYIAERKKLLFFFFFFRKIEIKKRKEKKRNDRSNKEEYAIVLRIKEVTRRRRIKDSLR